MARTAVDLHRHAVALSIQGKYGAALRTIEAPLARTDDPDLRARLAGTQAIALQRTGSPERAEQVCRAALATPGLSSHTRAILDGQLGALAMYGGRLDEADVWLTRAIDNLRDDPVAEARIRINRSLMSIQRRHLDSAAADLTVAVATLTGHGLEMEAAQARHNLGYTALLRGDLISALHEMLVARPAAVSSSVVAAAVGDLDRAEVLRDAGLTVEAERILAASARVFGASRMPQSRAEAEVNLARSQLTHDPAAAARTAASAARRFKALGNDAWGSRAEGIRVRAALSEGVLDRSGNRARAVRRIPGQEEVEAVASGLEAAGLPSDAVAVRLAAELRAARRGAERGAPVRVAAGAPLEVRLLAHQVRVARALAAGREAEVRRRAAAGVDELSHWLESFGSLDLQASVVGHSMPLMLAGLSSAMRSRRPDVLFEWSERARHVSQRVVPLRPPVDAAAAADLSELRLLRLEDPGGDWLATPRAAELRERVRSRQWAATGAHRIEARASLEHVQDALDGDTALLAYIWSEGTLVCLVVRHDSARIVDLPGWAAARSALNGLRADLDVSAAVRSGPMAAIVRRALDERLELFSRHLLDAPLAVAGARRLVMTTPGIMAAIPWSMLPGMRGHPFTLAISATRWLRMREVRQRPLTAGIAVGPRVARGGEEADVAAAAWAAAGRPATTVRGAAASVDAVTDLAANVSVLHVAAHGRHAADNPLFSGVELADGALFGYDIDRIPHLPETVVLSACEVGRSSVRWGEEAVGMTRTWLHAGTRCVISAPVIVADDVACELLGSVHVGLAAGEPPAEALAAAAAATGLVAPFECHGSGF